MNIHENQKPVFTSRRMEQQWSRMQGIKMVRSGQSVVDVAKFFGVSRRAVYQWLSVFSESGQNGLLAKSGAGRPPKVSAEQMQWIAFMVRDRTPNQLQFEFGLWTLRLIGQLIKRQFGMDLSLPTLGKLMAQLGITIPRQSRGFSVVSRSKRLNGVANAAPTRGATVSVALYLHSPSCSILSSSFSWCRM